MKTHLRIIGIITPAVILALLSSSAMKSAVTSGQPPAIPSNLTTTPVSPANNNTPVISGTTSPNARVIIRRDSCAGAIVDTITADSSGSFSTQVSLGDNTTTQFYLTATDAANHASFCSFPLTYVEDSQAPLVPTGLTIAPITNSNDNSPVLSGSAEPFVTVQIFVSACSGSPGWTTTSDASGTFSATLSVGDNTTTSFYAKAVDQAGNSSSCTSGATYHEDSSVLDVPTNLSFTPQSHSNNNFPAINGTAQSGTNIRVFRDSCGGTIVGSQSSITGSFSISLNVPDNTASKFYVDANLSGNFSSCSPVAAYIEDSQPPDVPANLSVFPHRAANYNSPILSGTAEPFSSVRIFVGTCSGTAAETVMANSSGIFNAGMSVGDNTTTTFFVKAGDSAGNISACSSSITYLEDSQSPNAPVNLSLSPDQPANNNSPALSGTAEPFATVRIFAGACGGSLSATTTADAGGTFSVPLSVVDNSTTTFFAEAEDSAGNFSDCSSGIMYIEDSQPPSPPTNLSTDQSGTNATVRWNSSADNDLLRYRIYGGTAPSPTTVLDSASRADTSRLIGNLTPDVNYYFRMTALDSSMNESVYSEEVQTQTKTGCSIIVHAGWNLLSLPLKVGSAARDTLFPGASSNAFIYTDKYEVADPIPHSRGFWIKFNSPESVAFAGIPILQDTVDVLEGWNLIGSLFNSISISNISSIPPQLVTSEFFAYQNGAYKVNTVIDSGQGNWVKVSASGKLVLSVTISSTPSSRIRIRHSEELPPAHPAGTSNRVGIPKVYALYQNYPNPFNPSTQITFDIPTSGPVVLTIYNILGEKLKEVLNGEFFEAGRYAREIDATDLSSGIYFVKMQAGMFLATRKMVLLR